MFSGIVEIKVKAKKIVKTTGGLRITLPKPNNWKLQSGESVNIDGVCSTVESLSATSFTVFYMPETLDKTTFKTVLEDHEFNLEKSLTLNSLVGGHLVSGHVDTTSKVTEIVDEKESKVIIFAIPSKFTKYIVYKGSVCVNGVSLTVVEVSKKSFKVSLIPHTLKITNLGRLKMGDFVNIEIDLIVKYLEKLVSSKN